MSEMSSREAQRLARDLDGQAALLHAVSTETTMWAFAANAVKQCRTKLDVYPVYFADQGALPW